MGLDSHEGSHCYALTQLGLAIAELDSCLVHLFVCYPKAIEDFLQKHESAEESAVIFESLRPIFGASKCFLTIPGIETNKLAHFLLYILLKLNQIPF